MEALVLGLGAAAFGGVIGSGTNKLIDVGTDLVGELLYRDKPLEQLEDEIGFLREVVPQLKKVIWSAELKEETKQMRRAWQAFVAGAEDVLDKFDTQAAQHGRSNQAAAPVPPLTVCPSNSRCSPSNVTDQIRGLYDGLEKVKSDVDKIQQFVASAEEGLRLSEGESTRRDTTYEFLAKNFRFVGREKMKKEIIAELLSQPSSSEPTVVLVKGIGGIGKTTLVKDILRQTNIANHFDFKKWVCVGDELDLKTVTRSILKNDSGDVTEIRSQLEGKRFLIVLDDCWSGKLKSWKDLWGALTYGSDGSKVLITSREDISSELLLESMKEYELGVLSNKECLQIFESSAFLDKETSGSRSTSRLQDSEKKFLNEKIKGLPLAATVLGSSLSKVRRDQWEQRLKGVVQSDIMSVLMWSYRRLPWYLKQCFAYLSVFPKDYKLQKEHVVWMWMAHDYVQPEDNQTSEDIGLKYFDDLVGASLIQKMQGDEESDVYYNMHDLVHDLATKVSIGGCFPYKHLSITDDKSFHKYFDNNKKLRNKKLRTLLLFWQDADITNIQLQYVRVLLVSGTHLAQIDFNEMRYLMYLDLTRVANDTLSESICDIYSLQTLLLPTGGKNFPLHRWNLPNLCHFGEGDAIRMTGISNSKSIHTISCFTLFQEGEDIKELANLKELRKLRIYHLNRVTSPRNALEAQLHDKAYIEELALSWEQPSDHHMPCEVMVDKIQNGILENLHPQQSLRTLEILHYMGDQLPSWMSSIHLPHLMELKLCDFYHVVELPALGHLPSLEHLVIDGLRKVSHIGDGFYGTGDVVFPSLKVLELKELYGLREWKESGRHKDGIHTCFPSLERLEIWDCKKLRNMPRLLPRCLKQMTIVRTGLEALPEKISSACTDDHPEYCCDIPCLQELTIAGCRSLRPEEWFRRHRMPALQELRLEDVGGYTNMVINYSRKCLTRLEISWMRCVLRSIRLCNIAPLDEFGEAHYPLLSIHLMQLSNLEEMFMVNSEDGNITAGPLEIKSYTWIKTTRVVENLSKMMLQDQDYSVKNAVECLKLPDAEGLNVLLRVEPRSKRD